MRALRESVLVGVGLTMCAVGCGSPSGPLAPHGPEAVGEATGAAVRKALEGMPAAETVPKSSVPGVTASALLMLPARPTRPAGGTLK